MTDQNSMMHNCTEGMLTHNVTAVAYTMDWYISTYFTCCIVLTALLSNVLTIGALRTHVNPRPVICQYLMGLAVWDLLLATCSVLMTVVPRIFFGDQQATILLPFYPVLLFASNATAVGNVWTLVLLALDRYMLLRNPFSRLSRKRTKLYRVLGVSGFVACLYCWPKLLELSSVGCIDPVANVVHYMLVASELRSNRFYYIGHRVIGGFLLYSVLPYCVILTLTIGISRALRQGETHIRAAKSASMAANSKKRQARVHGQYQDIVEKQADLLDSSNRMLLTVNIKYMILQLPTVMLDVLELFIPEHIFLSDKRISLVVALSNFLVTLNSSTNFLVYWWLSSFFRRAVTRLLRGHINQEAYTLYSVGLQIRVLSICQAGALPAMVSRRTQPTNMDTNIVREICEDETILEAAVEHSRSRRSLVRFSDPSLVRDLATLSATEGRSCMALDKLEQRVPLLAKANGKPTFSYAHSSDSDEDTDSDANSDSDRTIQCLVTTL